MDKLVHRCVKLGPYKFLQFFLVVNLYTELLNFGHSELRYLNFFKFFEILGQFFLKVSKSVALVVLIVRIWVILFLLV